MQSTYKKITKIIQNIVDNHPILQSVYFTDVINIDDGEKLFPFLTVELSDVTMPINSEKQFTESLMNLNIKIYDLLNNDNSNQIDVESDTLQMIQDVITVLAEHKDMIDYMLTPYSSFVINRINNVLASNAIGWQTTFGIKAHNNVCIDYTPQKIQNKNI